MSLDDYMTTEEVAAALGITKRAVQKLIERDRLPAKKAGRDYLIARSDFEAYKPRKAGRPKKIAS